MITMTDSHTRSLIKGITWRITGTIDTMVMAFIVTGHFTAAIKIGLTEVFTKVGLYYLHERLWNVIPFGRINGVGPTHARSITKGVSWRVIGTIDTIFFSTSAFVLRSKLLRSDNDISDFSEDAFSSLHAARHKRLAATIKTLNTFFITGLWFGLKR